LGSSADGQRWNTFLGPFIQNELMSSGLWDGVFLDAAYGDLTTTFGPDLDPDQNGLANASKHTDEAWRVGMTKLIKNVRTAIGPDKLIMNNSSAAYSGLVNGTLYENFPRFGWAWPFYELRSSLERNISPKISAINTNTNNQEQPGNYRLMRYGLSSALVADAYFSFDAGDSGHQRTWWYDEYDAQIGRPRALPRVVRGPTQGAYPAVWSRAYERGAVFVNSTAKAETITLSGEFEKLTGAQDPSVNDGSIINRITLPPQDGAVLLRRAEATTIRDAQYLNGTFVQVYDGEGKRLRNGFFASRDDVPGGVNVLVSDVDRDGTDDILWSQDGRVNIRFGKGGSVSFRPYGASYRGLIEIAAGQTNRDVAWELVLSPSDGLPSKILITNLRGQVLRSWLAYRPEFTGGSIVALGDVDGDGLREVATGAGRGGGPHARLFRTDGALWGGGFFAFDSHERGGVTIAMGDLDGDGRQEMVAGSGRGSVPRVRVYDGRGILKSEFTLGNAPTPIGVKPIVSDIDGDGKAEILIPGNPF
ncbi:MAG: putative glycoside hydrolase, partial [Candidatus Uhrbacteria bacterium]|nr:putative glycoside hydrolase [Candidatus Uhrbacteria bacterium]